MIPVEIKVHGLDKLEAAMKKLPVEIGQKCLEVSLLKASQPLREAVVSRAPVHHKSHWSDYQGGRLRADIKSRTPRGSSWLAMKTYTTAPGTAHVAVGVTHNRAFYASQVEFGHAGPKGPVAPQPFMRPAWEASVEQVIDTFVTELPNQMQKQLGGLRR